MRPHGHALALERARRFGHAVSFTIGNARCYTRCFYQTTRSEYVQSQLYAASLGHMSGLSRCKHIPFSLPLQFHSCLLLRVLQDTLSFQSSPRLLQCPGLDAAQGQYSPELASWLSCIPCIRLEPVSHNTKSNGPIEPIEPHLLPTFILILLTGLHTKQPAGRGIIVVLVRVVGLSDLGRGDCSLLERAAGDTRYDLELPTGGVDEGRGAEKRHCGDRQYRCARRSGEVCGRSGSHGAAGQRCCWRYEWACLRCCLLL